VHQLEGAWSSRDAAHPNQTRETRCGSLRRPCCADVRNAGTRNRRSAATRTARRCTCTRVRGVGRNGTGALVRSRCGNFSLGAGKPWKYASLCAGDCATGSRPAGLESGDITEVRAEVARTRVDGRTTASGGRRTAGQAAVSLSARAVSAARDSQKEHACAGIANGVLFVLRTDENYAFIVANRVVESVA